MMRKSTVSQVASTASSTHVAWMDIERVAKVEISSEDELFPIEHALGAALTKGWRAAETGPQMVRLKFDEPQRIRRIQLHFVDQVAERAQEFSIFALIGKEFREVARQQWMFSPYGSTEELEDYMVELAGVTVLELRIDPDRSHDPKLSRSFASLKSMRLA